MNNNSKYSLKKISKKGLVYGKLASIGIATFIASMYIGKNIIKEHKQEEQTTTENYSLCAGITAELSENIILENAEISINTNKTNEVNTSNQDYADYVFEYEYEDRSNHEKIVKASNYDELFEKYSNIYGLDKNLLRALCAQESGGNPNVSSGYASGLMQVAISLYGKNIHAYNFETGETETETVDANRINDPDYNIKLGSMLLQCYMNEFNYDIAKGVTAYNMGDGNLLKLSNDNWMNERDHIQNADVEFFEHVFSFIEDGTIISIRNIETGEYQTYKLDNTSVNTYVKVK